MGAGSAAGVMIKNQTADVVIEFKTGSFNGSAIH
jgi:hypothetical protein